MRDREEPRRCAVKGTQELPGGIHRYTAARTPKQNLPEQLPAQGNAEQCLSLSEYFNELALLVPEDNRPLAGQPFSPAHRTIAAYEKGRAWSDYLENLASEEIHINPYTGTIIE